MGHEAVVTFEARQNRPRFSAREDDRQLGRPPDAFHPGDEVELLLQHLLVEEKQRAKGLVLRGSGDALIDGEMTKEGCDLSFAHFGRVAFFVKEDIPADPIQIGPLSSDAVTFHAQMPANAVE
jgi:hypothetical protein